MNKLYIFLTVMLIGSACSESVNSQYQYKVPEPADDGIITGNILDTGLDTGKIFEAMRRIDVGKYPEVHGVLLYKDGKLILEEYFKGHRYKWDAPAHHGEYVQWDKAMLHRIHSVTKSVTATLVDLAIKNGYIKSVDESIFNYLPDHQQFRSAGREYITIEHLLTMSSGLDWYEWNAPYSSRENPIIEIWFSDKDPVSFILDQKMVEQPGIHFSYYGGHQILLGRIIENTSGMPLDDFADRYLFEPLGIDSVNWAVKFRTGEFEAAGCLDMRHRDMLKLGVLYRNKGKWNGKQIIDASWVEKTSVPYNNNTGIKVPEERSGRLGYSYSWWIKDWNKFGSEYHSFYAGGWGGQFIFVFPELDMVVVFTGGNYLSWRPPFRIMKKHFLPAVKASR